MADRLVPVSRHPRGGRRRSIGVFAAVLVALLAASPQASSPKFFQVATESDFLKGDLDGLSIDTRGQLSIGAANELVYETAAPFLWAMVPGSDGSLFIGTGNEGKVFRIDGDGKGTMFFDSVEL